MTLLSIMHTEIIVIFYVWFTTKNKNTVEEKKRKLKHTSSPHNLTLLILKSKICTQRLVMSLFYYFNDLKEQVREKSIFCIMNEEGYMHGRSKVHVYLLKSSLKKIKIRQ